MRVRDSRLALGVCGVFCFALHGLPVHGAVASVCGDGVTESVEECDDGGLCEDGVTLCTMTTAGVDCDGVGSGLCAPQDNDGCSATCVVESGFECDTSVAPSDCYDVDECYLRTHDCGMYAVCTNTVGGFTCACKPGYVGDGYVCTDINECSDPDLNDCHVYGRCINYSGGFNCACNAGFIGDGRTCTDIDECNFNSHNCDSLANCSNTVGSFTCACPAGYEGDARRNGTGCVDVDECLDGTDNCTSSNGSCENLDGGYDCVCDPGYVGDATLDGTGCVGHADVALLSIVDTPDPAVAGQSTPVTYEYSMTNYGPVDATGVVLTVSLHKPFGATLLDSDGGCVVAGGSVTCGGPTGTGFDLRSGEDLVVTVHMGIAGVTSAGFLDCTANVSGSELDPDLSNNVMDASTELSASCGDGVVNNDEQCDDGTANSDVDPDACRTDCRSARCGDGVIDSAEQCDDANTKPGDGCDEGCLFEAGACCVNDACVQLTLDECSVEGGSFFGTGTLCDDPDADLDGVRDECDACPWDALNDEDGDGLCGDVDNCPFDSNSDQTDTDDDGEGDSCDNDDDGDGVDDLADLCPLEHPQGLDADGDGCVDQLGDLDDVIRELGLPRGASMALLQTVKGAQQAYARGKVEATKGKLRALLNKLRAMSGKRISRDDADMLMTFVENVLTQLGLQLDTIE